MDLSSFVRQDISGIRKDILPLSGFGILSHALADEIAARNQTREGYFYTTDMEFLEEAEPEQPPVLPPRPRQPDTIRMDMTLLFKIMQEAPESGKNLPAGTQKMLERVRTILRTSPQSRAVSAPQAVRKMYVPLPQSAPSTQGTRLTPTALRQSAPQSLHQNRMQNPLRDPKAPLAVEKMQMPSREVPRASDHAMLFSDVLHRAQDSGLTFATRKGQGGIPISAQTRTAYTTQALRQAKAEQQAAEEQSIPVWQRAMRKDVAQTTPDVVEPPLQFNEPDNVRQKANEITIDNALKTEGTPRTVSVQRMPDNAASVLRQMAAPRYPETELNFVQEEAPMEGAEMPVPTAQHPSAESIRAMQEASAKALTESVRSALKEAAPLMTATAQETLQKQAEQAVQSAARREMAHGTPQNASPANATTRAASQTQNIPPQNNTAVENRAEKTTDAVNPSAVTAPGKAQAQRTENNHTAASRDAEPHRMQEQTAEIMQSQLQNRNAGAKSADVEHSESVVSAQPQDAEHKTDVEHETGAEQTADEKREVGAERIPALNGDRAFAETPDNAASVLRQMAAPRYPETELNFVQEEVPTEGAEMPVSTAQHPGAESIRAMQEASAKALTESVRSALKEAAPLMTATAQETVQKQAEQSVARREMAHGTPQNASPANVTVRAASLTQNIPPQNNTAVENRAEKTANAVNPSAVTAPGKMQAQRTENKHTAASRNAENIPVEKVLSADLKKTSAILTRETTGQPEAMQKQNANFAEHKTVLQKVEETPAQKTVERSRKNPEDQTQMSGNAEPHRMQEQTAEITREQMPDADIGTKETALTAENPESTISTQPQEAERKANVEHETGTEQTADAKHEVGAERIPALNGDRTFAETPDNAASVLRQMAAPRYPETKLNFVQEEAPTEGAEMPVSTAQHPSAESIRAMQEASAKALTESVRAALKEAAPLMAATAQETLQKQAVQSVARREMAHSQPQNASLANATTRAESPTQNISPKGNTAVENRAEKTTNAVNSSAMTVPGKTQERHTENKDITVSRNAENIPVEKVLSADVKKTSATLTRETTGKSEAMREQTANFVGQGTALQKAAETPAQETVERSRKNPEDQTQMSGNAEPHRMQEQTAEIMQSQLQNGNAGAKSANVEHSESVVSAQPQEAELKANVEHETGAEQTSGTEHEESAERIPALNGDRAFAETPDNAASVLQQLAAPRYPETELNFAQEEAPTEGAEMPVSMAQHPSAESIRAMQEASAKALTESVRSALKEATPLMAATAQETVQKQAEQAVQNAVTAVLEEKTVQSGTPAQNRLTQKAAEAVNRSIDTVLKQSTPQLQRAVQTQEKVKLQELHQALRQETVETVQQAVAEGRNATTAAQKNRALRSERIPRQENRTVQNTPDMPGVSERDAVEGTEGRLPPLSGGQTIPGQPNWQNAGQAGGMERAVELLRQNGYGAAPLEYRMEDAAPETAAVQELSSRQAGAAAEKSLLWLGEKVAANAARELSRMQRTMSGQQNGMARPGQPGNTGSIGHAADAQNTASAGRAAGNAGAPYTVGRMTAQPFHPTALHTAARPMGIPAEAQWRPSNQTAPAQMVSPAEMPQLMYQTGQSEGAEVPFAPAGGTKHALPQLGNSMEAQSAYPALSMEYSSPMSRMEQQLQSAMAQQMSAASRPMAMQTEAGQYMAGKAAPGGMTTLDQMSAPPVNDQIVWQNPYLRSAPADMTYRNKKKPVEQQPQPAPRPQAVRMSDAEIHRMADQVFRIVKDKIRQERRKMGL